MRPQRLSTRLMLGIAALVVFSGLLISQMVTTRYSRSLYETAEGTASNLAHKLALDIGDSLLINDLVRVHKIFDDQMASNPSVAYLFVVSPDGEVLVHSFAGGFPLELVAANRKDPPPDGSLHEVWGTDGRHFLDAAWPIFGGNAGTLRLGLSLSPFHEKVRTLWLEMSLMTLVILVIAISGSLVLIRWITKPLAFLTKSLETMDVDKMNAKVDVEGYFEVESLSRSFNTMLERIKDHTRQLHAQREEIQRAYAQTQTCLTISQEIGMLTTLDQVGAYLIEKLRRVVTCNRIALLVLSSSREVVYLVTQNNLKKILGPPAAVTTEMLKGINEISFLSRSQSADLPLPSNFTDRENMALFPLMDKGRTLGSIIVACPGNCRCARRDVSIIETIVSQSVGAIRRSITFEEQYRDARDQDAKQHAFAGMIGRDPKMQLVFDLIRDIAETDASVLIQGESGTGKELVAKAIHDHSHRGKGPFMVINCSAYPETLLESELFGHERGAFTGALRQKPGRFEQADGGTVFLDEIGEISPSAQIRLLRVLQTRQFERIGGEKSITVDVRILAATNKDLLREVEDGRFREDLYYRLNVIPISMPPLRERQNDIPLLARHFLKIFAKEQGKELQDFAPEALRLLLDYSWPGNVRELENTIEHAVVLAKSRIIDADDLPKGLQSSDFKQPLPARTLQNTERQHLMETLKSCEGNKTETARRLGISRSTLYAKLRKYGLD